MKNSFKPLATGELYQRNPQQSNAIYQYVNVLIMKDLSDLRFSDYYRNTHRKSLP